MERPCSPRVRIIFCGCQRPVARSPSTWISALLDSMMAKSSCSMTDVQKARIDRALRVPAAETAIGRQVPRPQPSLRVVTIDRVAVARDQCPDGRFTAVTIHKTNPRLHSRFPCNDTGVYFSNESGTCKSNSVAISRTIRSEPRAATWLSVPK